MPIWFFSIEEDNVSSSEIQPYSPFCHPLLRICLRKHPNQAIIFIFFIKFFLQRCIIVSEWCPDPKSNCIFLLRRGHGVAEITLMHKKGIKTDLNNYKPISLPLNISKLFKKNLKERIVEIFDSKQPIDQEGFIKGFATSDYVFTLNQVIEKAREYYFEENLLLIDYDYNEAFDWYVNEEKLTWTIDKSDSPVNELIWKLELLGIKLYLMAALLSISLSTAFREPNTVPCGLFSSTENS